MQFLNITKIILIIIPLNSACCGVIHFPNNCWERKHVVFCAKNGSSVFSARVSDVRNAYFCAYTCLIN